jgi:hypothetical protein
VTDFGPVTWITTDDVGVALGMDTATAADDAYLAMCTDAANQFAYRRRGEFGYHDSLSEPPGPDARLGTVLYAQALYRERGAVDGHASFAELGTYPAAPFDTGAMGQINKLLGVPRMAVDVAPTPTVNPLGR